MAIPIFTINLDKKCAECGEGGAAANGLCLSCTTRTIQGKPMKSAIGRAVAQRAREVFGRRSK